MTHTIDKLAEVLEGFLETLYFWFMWPFRRGFNIELITSNE